MIYHITRKEIYESEKNNLLFGKDEIERYGFIHSSNEIGLNRIIKRYLDNIDDYLVLCIDEKQLLDQIVYEDKDTENLYPHFYKPIESKHIKEVISLNEFIKE